MVEAKPTSEESTHDTLANIYACEHSQNSQGDVLALAGDTPESTADFFHEVFPSTHLDKVYVMPFGWVQT